MNGGWKPPQSRGAAALSVKSKRIRKGRAIDTAFVCARAGEWRARAVWRFHPGSAPAVAAASPVVAFDQSASFLKIRAGSAPVLHTYSRGIRSMSPPCVAAFFSFIFLQQTGQSPMLHKSQLAYRQPQLMCDLKSWSDSAVLGKIQPGRRQVGARSIRMLPFGSSG